MGMVLFMCCIGLILQFLLALIFSCIIYKLLVGLFLITIPCNVLGLAVFLFTLKLYWGTNVSINRKV